MPLREKTARALVPPGEDPDRVVWFGAGQMRWWEACLPDADRVIPLLPTTPSRAESDRG